MPMIKVTFLAPEMCTAPPMTRKSTFALITDLLGKQQWVPLSIHSSLSMLNFIQVVSLQYGEDQGL